MYELIKLHDILSAELSQQKALKEVSNTTLLQYLQQKKKNERVITTGNPPKATIS
jgi:hypothetical protein